MKKFLAGFLIGDCAPLNLFLKPVMLLGFRLYVAYVFFKSGLTKVGSDFKVTSSTIDLFKYEYMPYLSEELATTAAYLASYAELVLPVLLVIGFLSRPAALALFILNAVAAHSFLGMSEHNWLGHSGDWQHILWGTIIAVVFAFGPGSLSIDKWISNKWKRS